MNRSCSGCTLCCRLLPMKAGKTEHFDETVQLMINHGIMTRERFEHMTPDFDKPAGKRCPHQCTGKGCAIYSRRPWGCTVWSCAWLINENNQTADLRRPDRSHYVIDISPDFVTDSESGENIPVIQVWCDPKHRDAHRDPALRAYLEARGKEGYAALIRYSAHEGMVIFPPSLTGGQGWIEKEPNGAAAPEHTIEQKVAALGPISVNFGAAK